MGVTRRPNEPVAVGKNTYIVENVPSENASAKQEE